MVVQAMKNRMMKKQAKQTNIHTYIQAKQIVTGTRLDDQGQSWSQSSKSMTWNAYLLECKRLKPNGNKYDKLEHANINIKVVQNLEKYEIVHSWNICKKINRTKMNSKHAD